MNDKFRSDKTGQPLREKDETAGWGVNLHHFTDAEALEILRRNQELERQRVELEHRNRQLQQAVEQFESQRNEYSDLIQSAPVAFLSIDPRGMVRQANQAAVRMLGGELSTLLGAHFPSLVFLRDQGRLFSYLKTLSLNEAAGICELRLLSLKDENRRIIELKAAPKFNMQRVLTHWHFVLVDITDRKRAELALLQSEEKFSKAFYSSPSLLFICELDTGNFVDVNHAYCHLTGYSREEMIGRSSLELGLLSAESRAKIIERIINSGTMQNMELQIVTRSGEILNCLFSAETMEYLGKPCLVYSGVDITERRQAEDILLRYREKLELEVKNRTAEIEQQNRELQQLNLVIKKMSSHTIKAMENDRRALSKEIHDSIGGSLAAIKMLLESHLPTADADLPDSMGSLEKIIEHLSETIKESKRISYQMRSMALDDFGLEPAISETIRKFEEFYPAIELQHRIHISNDSIPDEIQTVLYRVIQEGLNNIGKHSRAERAKIELSESQDQLLLVIEDNGVGFDFSGSVDAHLPLQGYGMHSMKERVEVCRGHFEVVSAPGQGTRLQASIPKLF